MPAVWALEADRTGDDAARASPSARRERSRCVGSGAPIEPMPPRARQRIVTAAFSGGRDSLTQLGMLQELGETPLLVTVTSTREGSEEFKTAAPARR